MAPESTQQLVESWRVRWARQCDHRSGHRGRAKVGSRRRREDPFDEREQSRLVRSTIVMNEVLSLAIHPLPVDLQALSPALDELLADGREVPTEVDTAQLFDASE